MQTGSYINGEWYQPNSERQIRNVNPADTRDVIAEFSHGLGRGHGAGHRRGRGGVPGMAEDAGTGARAGDSGGRRTSRAGGWTRSPRP